MAFHGLFSGVADVSTLSHFVVFTVSWHTVRTVPRCVYLNCGKEMSEPTECKPGVCTVCHTASITLYHIVKSTSLR